MDPRDPFYRDILEIQSLNVKGPGFGATTRRTIGVRCSIMPYSHLNSVLNCEDLPISIPSY